MSAAAAAQEINVDAEVVAVLSGVDGIFTLTLFLVDAFTPDRLWKSLVKHIYPQGSNGHLMLPHASGGLELLLPGSADSNESNWPILKVIDRWFV